MAKASRDTQKGRKRVKGKRKGEKEKKREGEKKERERERKRERRKGQKYEDESRCSQLRASVQGHTKERGIPECYIQEYTKKAKREEGEGRGRKGTKAPADSNEP